MSLNFVVVTQQNLSDAKIDTLSANKTKKTKIHGIDFKRGWQFRKKLTNEAKKMVANMIQS